MKEVEGLVKRFDAGVTEDHGFYCQKVSKPTKKSIEVINQKLGIIVPKSLVGFLSLSYTATSWFASFGEDYKNICHVLQLNRRLKKIRRRVIGGKGKWEYVFPRHFVAFNMGFDYDYDCFDLSTFDKSTGEYNIIYWAPPRYFGDKPQVDFCSYMEKNLEFWNK